MSKKKFTIGQLYLLASNKEDVHTQIYGEEETEKIIDKVKSVQFVSLLQEKNSQYYQKASDQILKKITSPDAITIEPLLKEAAENNFKSNRLEDNRLIRNFPGKYLFFIIPLVLATLFAAIFIIKNGNISYNWQANIGLFVVAALLLTFIFLSQFSNKIKEIYFSKKIWVSTLLIAILISVSPVFYTVFIDHRISSPNGLVGWGGDVTLGFNIEFTIDHDIQITTLSKARFKVGYLSRDNFNVELKAGTLLVDKRGMNKNISISTNKRTYKAVGTRFIIHVSDKQEMIFLLKGEVKIFERVQLTPSIIVKSGAQSNNFTSLKNGKIHTGNISLQQLLAKILPVRAKEIQNSTNILFSNDDLDNSVQRHIKSILKKEQASHKIMTRNNKISRFKKGDCVFYYRGNERFKGKIYAKNNGEFTIERDGIQEPHLYSSDELRLLECRAD